MNITLCVACFGLAMASCGVSHVACEQPCLSNDMKITSSGDLMSATDSCGQSAKCAAESPCSSLDLPPPAEGGACHVVITSTSGTVESDANWGTARDTCCGRQFENTPTLSLGSDAGDGG